MRTVKPDHAAPNDASSCNQQRTAACSKAQLSNTELRATRGPTERCGQRGDANSEPAKRERNETASEERSYAQRAERATRMVSRATRARVGCAVVVLWLVKLGRSSALRVCVHYGRRAQGDNNEYGVLDFVQSVRMCALVKLGDQAFEKSESVVVCYCCCLFI